MLWQIIAQASSAVDQAASFGVAGIMGAMWLWERRTSRVREQQLDEAHARIMSDRILLDQVIALVRQNAEAMARLAAAVEQKG